MTDSEAPQVDGNWSLADWWGAVMVRCKYGRDTYRVEPGLYRSGSPGSGSPVLVTADRREEPTGHPCSFLRSKLRKRRWPAAV